MVQIYLDGVKLNELTTFLSDSRIGGFTSNPTLARASGVEDYLSFATEFASRCAPKPLSVEVTAEEHGDVVRQAKILSAIGKNVVVKIPIVSTSGASMARTIGEVSDMGIAVNVTAVFTEAQVREAISGISSPAGGIISVFAGRIADAGVDPVPLMREYVSLVGEADHIRLLWASPREVLNVYQAEELGVDIITVPRDIWGKVSLRGRDLTQFSVETVEMFLNDARSAGFNF